MKKPISRIAALLCAVMLLSFLAGCGAVCDVPVSVMLADGEGYTVTSANPVTVKAGEDAVFDVQLDDGYVYVSNSANAAYKDGRLTVSRVLYPQTVSVKTVVSTGKNAEFSLYDMSQSGTLLTTLAPGEYPEGVEGNVLAQPYEGYKFVGWTRGMTLARGGAVVSRDPSYSFTLDGDLALYANFALDDGVVETYCNMLYNANGGVVAETGETFCTVEVDTSVYKCPNSLIADDTFVREGYQLIEYNTKPDGSGDAYSIGSKIILSKDDPENVTLFCIWAKESDASLFTTSEKSGKITITGYTGDEKMIVIPEKIGGKPVTSIGQKAFKELSVETIVLPKTIETVPINAIYDCASFTTLYLFDNITSIQDKSIAGKNNFKHFLLNTAMEPRYANSVEGEFARKWERLVTSDKPCIIVMSGSSSLNGLNSPMMEEAFDYKYTVVNYGTNAGTCGVLYMEFVSHFVEDGDILIDAPEMGSAQGGPVSIMWKVFRGTEMYNNIWRYIDISRYTNVFSALTEHNATRKDMRVTSYTDVSTGMDEYGDLQSPDRAKMNNPKYNAGSSFGLSTNTFAGKNAENLNWVFSVLEDAGCTVYFSCAPFNANCLTPAAKKAGAADAYDEANRKNLNVPVISKVMDYAIPGEYMYNSDWHPNDTGRDLRTQNLIRDMKAQMVKDGLWTE